VDLTCYLREGRTFDRAVCQRILHGGGEEGEAALSPREAGFYLRLPMLLLLLQVRRLGDAMR